MAKAKKPKKAKKPNKRPSSNRRPAAGVRRSAKKHGTSPVRARPAKAQGGVRQLPKTVSLKDVQVGDKLPDVAIDLTTTLIVAGALASHDFTPVHHDKGAAQSQGMQDVFMNILTTNGLVGRYVTDWAGPNAVLKKVAIKLGAPNFPGDTMKMSGVVKGKEESAATVDLEVVGKNSWGNHVTAQVRVALPKER